MGWDVLLVGDRWLRFQSRGGAPLRRQREERCREEKQPVLFIWTSVLWRVQTRCSALWDPKSEPNKRQTGDP